jgi:hypothetical protein
VRAPPVGDRPALTRTAFDDRQGVWGTYDFTPNGDGLHSNSVVEIQPGGKLKLLKAVTIKPAQSSLRAVSEGREGGGEVATLFTGFTWAP